MCPVAKVLDAPLLSANVRDSDGQLITEPLRIVEAAGQRVALVGVLSQRYATDELQVAPPREAVLDVLQRAAERYDAVILLAYLPAEELRQLVGVLPEVDVVVGEPSEEPITPQPIGPTLFAYSTDNGRCLARCDAPASGSSHPWTGSIIKLNDEFTDDPQQRANLARFYQELARRDFTPDQSSFVKPLPADLPEGYRIAGSESCRECHENDYLKWERSKHAYAWDSLVAKGAHVDPECQRCHTTGYGLPGGFMSEARSPALVSVGCESCHGPSQAHVLDEKSPTAFGEQSKEQCASCHDHENSPEFSYPEYWSQINHGESPAVSSDASTASEDTAEGRR